jgi:hypothetical protein
VKLNVFLVVVQSLAFWPVVLGLLWAVGPVWFLATSTCGLLKWWSV